MRWIRDWSKAEDPSIRLLCLPCAGGGIHVYRRWAQRLPRWVGVLALELPGHDSRLTESPVTNLDELLEGPLIRAVEPLLDRPLALFGHSMGAMLAADLCQALQQRSDWQPALFVAAAAQVPNRERIPFDDTATDAQILSYLDAVGGTPPGIRGHDEFMRHLIDAVRADLALASRRSAVPLPKLSCPVRVYLGESDPSMSRADALAWQDTGAHDFAVRVFPGGHLFPQTATEPLLEALLNDLPAATER
ncbi:thioesterase II family protein [Nonomuraea guangzhouensis]|uniref:Thioesterase II family protein n=1 Tax=Nonomuraea guangzhouensis TaxID=1291555 RepID=A0ABW4H0G3_9ACTN|nr:alpha/beta fold hydrolase [Nonomuraea guangzhouensis]